MSEPTYAQQLALEKIAENFKQLEDSADMAFKQAIWRAAVSLNSACRDARRQVSEDELPRYDFSLASFHRYMSRVNAINADFDALIKRSKADWEAVLDRLSIEKQEAIDKVMGG